MTNRTRRRVGWSIAGLGGLALLFALVLTVPMHGVQTDADLIPTARVLQGDVPVVIHTTGEVRPIRSVGLVAPAIGGPLQILRITERARLSRKATWSSSST